MPRIEQPVNFTTHELNQAAAGKAEARNRLFGAMGNPTAASPASHSSPGYGLAAGGSSDSIAVSSNKSTAAKSTIQQHGSYGANRLKALSPEKRAELAKLTQRMGGQLDRYSILLKSQAK